MDDQEKIKIMVIDDNVTNLNVIRKALEKYYDVLLFTTGKAALKLFERMIPDLILLDVDMPGMDGFEVMKQIKKSPYPVHDIPVIFVTAMTDSESEYDGLTLGAVDYITKPFSYTLLLKRIELHLQLQHYSRHLENMVEEKTKTISELQYAIIRVMSDMVEQRDGFTGLHLIHTQSYLEVLLSEVKKEHLYEEELIQKDEQQFINASQLHDIGKISIPDYILLKPGKLTYEEFEVMKSHANLGEKAIRNVMKGIHDIRFLEIAAAFAGTHHEWWDGSGYPRALCGLDIPIEGRLMAIVDVYDALVSQRPYKKAFSHEEATAIIISESGTHFDPLLISAFEQVAPVFKTISQGK